MKNIEENTIYRYIKELGFSEAASRIYLALVTKGSLSISELSREAEVERTALYRMLNQLIQRGLVDEVLEYKARRYAAVSLERIRDLLESKRKKVIQLENDFDNFAHEIGTISSKSATQTRYYRGVAGIRQILWNETKAKGSQVAYTYRNLEEVVGVDYFREYAHELEKNHVSIRDLRSDSFLSSTDEPEFVRIHINNGIWRYLPDEILHLTHNMDIYDDVVSIYYWEENDVFGVEIQNQKIADTQRSIFEVLWQLAKKYKLPEKYKRLEKPEIE